MQAKRILLFSSLMLSFGFAENSYAQKYAARVLKTNRYATGNPDPNQVAGPADSGSGPMEEDLGPPSSGSTKKAKPIPTAPKAIPKQIEEPASDEPPRALPRVPRSSREESPPPTLPPEFRPRPEDNERAGDIDESGDMGIAIGIGFGYKKFSGSLGLTFPIYTWLAWNVSGSYETWVDGDDKQVIYGPETSLELRLQSRIPITPFAGAGGGYSHWSRSQMNEKFDDNGSLLSLYYLGISIPMAKRIAIDISQSWRTFLETSPRRFDDHSKRERYGWSRFDVGLSVHF